MAGLHIHTHKSTHHPRDTSHLTPPAPQVTAQIPTQAEMVCASLLSTHRECFSFFLSSTSLIPKMPQEPGLKVVGVGAAQG